MNIGDYWWLILGVVIIIVLLVILVVLKKQLNNDKKLLDSATAENVEQKEDKDKAKEESKDAVESKQVETTKENEETVKSENAEVEKENTNKEDDEIDFIPVETEPAKKSKKKVNNDDSSNGNEKKQTEAKVSEEQNVESENTENKGATKMVERYRVTYDKDKKDWVVKKDGAQRATKRFATKEEATAMLAELKDFNPRTPCGVRQSCKALNVYGGKFQSAHPLRGATLPCPAIPRRRLHFNPRTPCGVRRLLLRRKRCLRHISIHAPLAGCDV